MSDTVGATSVAMRRTIRFVPEPDAILRRVGYRWIALAVLCAAVILAILFSHLFFSIIAGAVPDRAMTVASLTALCVASPLVLVMVVAIRRLDRMGRAVRDRACALDRRYAALATAEDALRRSNETLEARVRARTHALDRALRAAEDADSRKTLFVASMSHELRTPLNAIIGFSDMLANRRALFGEKAEERVDEYSAVIGGAGAHLLSIVDDLLDLSRIECGQTDLSLATLDSGTVVEDAVRLLEPQAAKRGQGIHVRLDTTTPAFEADARAMHQILVNLLSNALKFSPRGAPVSVAVTEDAGDTVFSVEDRGPGMTVDEAREAVLPFARMSASHVAAGRSVGLGLPIVDALAQAHRGSLSFERGADGGTVARVRIPAPEARADRSRAA